MSQPLTINVIQLDQKIKYMKEILQQKQNQLQEKEGIRDSLLQQRQHLLNEAQKTNCFDSQQRKEEYKKLIDKLQKDYMTLSLRFYKRQTFQIFNYKIPDELEERLELLKWCPECDLRKKDQPLIEPTPQPDPVIPIPPKDNEEEEENYPQPLSSLKTFIEMKKKIIGNQICSNSSKGTEKILRIHSSFKFNEHFVNEHKYSKIMKNIKEYYLFIQMKNGVILTFYIKEKDISLYLLTPHIHFLQQFHDLSLSYDGIEMKSDKDEKITIKFQKKIEGLSKELLQYISSINIHDIIIFKVESH